MILRENALPDERQSIYLTTVLLGLMFFLSIFFFRSAVADFSTPFSYVFLGVVLIGFISGRFEAFIILFLVITSTVFELMEFPTVPIQVGDLYFSDILIILLLIGRLLKRVTLRVDIIPKSMGYPVLAFILVAAFAFIYSIIGSDVSISRAGVDFRNFFHLSLFFLVMYYVKNQRQLKSMMLGIGIVGSALAIMQLMQWIIGYEHNFLSCRVEAVVTAGREYEKVARVMFPGTSIILFTLNTIIAVYIFKGLQLRWRMLLIAATTLLSFAMLATFSRALWVAVLIGSLLIVFFARRKLTTYPRILLLVVGAALLITLGLRAKILQTDIVKDVIYSRSLSTVSAIRNLRDDTLYMRFMEYHYAWKKITENPLLGIGFGTAYRPNIFGNVEYERESNGTFVHNGYLAIQLRMGLLGSLVFLWLMLTFFYRVLSRWKKIKEPFYRAVVVGIAASILGVLIFNITTSAFLYIYWISMAAVGMGIAEKIYQFEGIA